MRTHFRRLYPSEAIKMAYEQVEHNGTTYDIMEFSLVSEVYRQRHAIEGLSYLDKEPQEQQVVLCVEWLLQYATPRKTANLKIGSYGLKHIVENWAKTYISNGAFILAARRQGVKIVPNNPNSPNAYSCLNYAREALVRLEHWVS